MELEQQFHRCYLVMELLVVYYLHLLGLYRLWLVRLHLLQNLQP
tara:strand:- start:243 stop:374 length:132 start_codon:yes stop_codon:yes gene_type:complete